MNSAENSAGGSIYPASGIWTWFDFTREAESPAVLKEIEEYLHKDYPWTVSGSLQILGGTVNGFSYTNNETAD